MLLFVGLGNPGARYAGNRHNVGFMAIDAIAHRFKAATWRKRFQSESTECVIGTEKALLLKPETFMNNSGQAVQEAAQFYKIALKAFAPWRRVETTGYGINGHEADIMPVSDIARSRIAKTYEEQHQLIFWVAALKVIL